MLSPVNHIGTISRDSIPPGTFFALDAREISGMLFAVELGLRLQGELPDIAHDYRAGSSLSDLSRKYNLCDTYGIQPKTAEYALRYALGGYSGSIEFSDIASYDGLIPSTEYKEIGKEHNQSTGRRIGNLMWETGKGVFGLSQEVKRDIALKVGNAAFENKTGIHAQTDEERREIGKLGAIAMGGNPWTLAEEEAVAALIKNPEYQRKSRINAQKIAEKINTIFHEGKDVRDARSVVRVVTRRLKKTIME